MSRTLDLARRALRRASELVPRPRPYDLGYGYQRELMRRVPATGRILDLASGHNPFPRATVLSERNLGETRHRQQPFTRDARPVVVLDIHHLPFADKSFDYIYCSHVLEHVDDPARACAEIMRVGKAGYIETPTAMKDALFGWAEEIGHRWHVTRVGRRLVFCEYEAGQRRGLGSELWRRAVLSRLYHPFQDLYFPHQAEFNVCLEWEGGFEVSVIRLDA